VTRIHTARTPRHAKARPHRAHTAPREYTPAPRALAKPPQAATNQGPGRPVYNGPAQEDLDQIHPNEPLYLGSSRLHGILVIN